LFEPNLVYETADLLLKRSAPVVVSTAEPVEEQKPVRKPKVKREQPATEPA
jgi:hypothetical protein